MPEVSHDDEFSEHLIQMVMDNYLGRDKREGKWHVSDLMFPRYAVLSRIHDRTPTRDDIGFFFTGEAYHSFFQKLLGEHNSECKGEFADVTGTADYFDGDLLLEIKTSRKWTVPEWPQDHYVEQIGYYCAIFNKPHARIVVIFPTAGRKWDGASSSTVEIRTWKVEFSPSELKEIRSRMTSLQKDLTRAFGKKDISGLPFCPDWKYGSVERDAEKKEYFVQVRCPFALEGLCQCGQALYDDMDKKNANRRVFPKR